MSTSKKIVVHCDTDGCGESIVIDESRVWEARVKSRDFGWATKGDTDTCPMHGGLL